MEGRSLHLHVLQHGCVCAGQKGAKADQPLTTLKHILLLICRLLITSCAGHLRSCPDTDTGSQACSVVSRVFQFHGLYAQLAPEYVRHLLSSLHAIDHLNYV